MMQWEREGKRETFHQVKLKRERSSPPGNKLSQSWGVRGVIVEGGEDSFRNLSQHPFDRVGV